MKEFFNKKPSFCSNKKNWLELNILNTLCSVLASIVKSNITLINVTGVKSEGPKLTRTGELSYLQSLFL